MLKELTSPTEATAKLVCQFQARGDTFELVEAETGSTLKAAAVITEIAAGTFTSDLPLDIPSNIRRHMEFEYFSRWHRALKSECSDRYSELREVAEPGVTKAEINQDETLQLLNGIRRGVHKAMLRTS